AGFRPQFSFALTAVPAADLTLGNHWSCTAPGARFVEHVVVSIVLPQGFATLIDQRYRRAVGDNQVEVVITDPRVYRMRLSMMFGIELSADEVAALGLF
ncbi:MAG: arylamine N-acetyltransferase, partial [Sphingomonas sp.]